LAEMDTASHSVGFGGDGHHSSTPPIAVCCYCT
jgi:hypothetical protein